MTDAGDFGKTCLSGSGGLCARRFCLRPGCGPLHLERSPRLQWFLLTFNAGCDATARCVLGYEGRALSIESVLSRPRWHTDKAKGRKNPRNIPAPMFMRCSIGLVAPMRSLRRHRELEKFRALGLLQFFVCTFFCVGTFRKCGNDFFMTFSLHAKNPHAMTFS